jgi:hypothetical protein
MDWNRYQNDPETIEAREEKAREEAYNLFKTDAKLRQRVSIHLMSKALDEYRGIHTPE